MRYLHLLLNTTKRSKKTYPVLGMVIVILGLSTCWYPYFDVQVSTGEAFIRKLPQPRVLTANLVLWDFNKRHVFLDTGYYLHKRGTAFPEMGGVGEGLWVVQKPNSTVYIPLDFGDDRFNQTDWTREQTNYIPPDLRQNWVSETGELILVSGGANNLGITGFMTPYFQESTKLQEFAPQQKRIGVGISPGIGSDRVILADWHLQNLRLSMGAVVPTLEDFEDELSLIEVGFDSVEFGIPKQGIPLIIPGTDEYFLSATMDDGTIKSFVWKDGLTGGPTYLPGIPHQITGVLSDGSPIARDSGQIHVYSLDSGGMHLFTLQTGNVYFSHEEFIDDQWYAIFTRSYAFEESSTRQFMFRVEYYRVATDDLKDFE